MERLEPTQEMASVLVKMRAARASGRGQLQVVAPLVVEKSSSNTWGWRRRCSYPAHVHVSSVSAAEQITVDAVVFAGSLTEELQAVEGHEMELQAAWCWAARGEVGGGGAARRRRLAGRRRGRKGERGGRGSDRKSTRLNSSHRSLSRMPSSA